MPRKSEYQISSGDFKDLVILVLDEHLKQRLATEISWLTIRDNLLKKISLDRYAYGLPKGKVSGRTNVDKWVYQAFVLLQKEGFLRKGTQRGFWSLSFEGVRKAVELQEKKIVYSTFTPTQETPRKPEVFDNSLLSLSFNWPPGDPPKIEKVIEDLLYQEAKCFGYFETTEKTCLECPLRFPCSSSFKDKLQEIEEELKEPQKKKAFKDPLPPSEKKVPLDPKLHPERVALLNRICPACKEEIQTGEILTWKISCGEIHPKCLKEKRIL